ncbi:MAG TPA: hypothetical protein VFT82_02935 [Candidatus Paceibacterota bacterium]|nr:hypothetical protein [Candidatus Paceibacterota bacterium]
MDSKEIIANLSRQIPPILMQTITSLTGINPVWGVLMSTSIGIINAWGDFGQSRVNEMVTYINEHRDEFVKEVIEGNNFKTLFLNILERHMKEASEEKRKLLRNYLLNVGKGIDPNFNEYTRMNNVLDTISLDEIDFLKLWDIDGPVTKYLHTLPGAGGMIVTVSDIQNAIFGMTPRDPKLMALVAEDRKNKNNQTMLFLGYKGLLYTAFADNFGSGQEARVKEITAFGKAFLAFIKA